MDLEGTVVSARRSNQSILKEISPGCSLEGMMLKLKLQYFGRLMRRVDSLEKTLMLGGIGGRRIAPPRHAHGDLTSLAPHERLPEILVVPREKTPTGAACRRANAAPQQLRIWSPPPCDA